LKPQEAKNLCNMIDDTDMLDNEEKKENNYDDNNSSSSIEIRYIGRRQVCTHFNDLSSTEIRCGLNFDDNHDDACGCSQVIHDVIVELYDESSSKKFYAHVYCARFLLQNTFILNNSPTIGFNYLDDFDKTRILETIDVSDKNGTLMKISPSNNLHSFDRPSLPSCFIDRSDYFLSIGFLEVPLVRYEDACHINLYADKEKKNGRGILLKLDWPLQLPTVKDQDNFVQVSADIEENRDLKNVRIGHLDW